MMATQVKTTEKSWQALTPDEKMERRFAAWLAASGIKFASPEAEQAYKARVKRITDTVRLKKTPDRVPLICPTAGLGGFAAAYCGYTHKDVMFDVDKTVEVINRCTLELQLDTTVLLGAQLGKVNEILDDKTHKWPGHGLPDDADGIQYLEDEYMKEDEYDAFFEDQTDYRLRTFLPRIWGAAAPLAKLMPMAQGNIASFVPFAQPEVKTALEKLAQAGQLTVAWQQKTGAANRRLTELGFPSLLGASAGVPFAQFGDSLRGTRGIMADMLKQPEKLLEAMERLVPIIVKRCVSAAKLGDSPIVDFHLHKGADRFMSDKQFRTFYWGPVRKVIIGLIEQGLALNMRFEGPFNSRLEVMRDLPKGKTLWLLGWETDIAQAKEIIGDVACISGNIPAALLYTGTPEEIAAYCRHLIKVAGKGGCYIFSMPLEGVNRNTKAENVRAMIKCVKEYGVYS